MTSTSKNSFESSLVILEEVLLPPLYQDHNNVVIQ